MTPCQWWTASPQGEIVFDCNVLSDAVCNNSQRGDWAREVIAWAGREAHEVLVSAMAHGEILAVLRKLELQQIADSRKVFPKGPGDFAAVDSQTIRSLCEEIWNIETTAVTLSAELRDRCLELRRNIVPYDAWYVAIADHYDAPLFTTDEKLVNAIGHTNSTVTAYSFRTDMERRNSEQGRSRIE